MTRQRLPSVGSLGRLSPLLQYYALLRLLVTHLDSPWFPLVPRYRPKKKTFSRKCRDLPGSWVTLCTYAALSDPGRIFVPSHEDEPTRGVAVPGDFRPRLTSLPVPQSALSRCLAASWHVDAAPALVNLEGSSSYFLSGLNHAASALAVYASQPASRQDHARLACQLVANLCCAGLVTRRVTFEVSTHVSSSAKLAWRNDHHKNLQTCAWPAPVGFVRRPSQRSEMIRGPREPTADGHQFGVNFTATTCGLSLGPSQV